MTKLRLSSTTDYMKLVDFFIKNDLEFDDDEAENENYVKAWEITHGGDLVAGISLSIREGMYVISGIAVDPIYRKMKIGKVLLDKAIDYVKKENGKYIILVARAPGFFKKFGFKNVPKEEEPDFFSCVGCPQNGVNCFPEVLKLELE
ncbi:MAG: GNAT family N-acetyltransferase [Clostridia bacterium]|nr:GNAT family N-acetyltransferase [Clostridia bacterium]